MTELPESELDWNADGHPVSERFGDVYFSGDGRAETRHVFLGGIAAPDAWNGASRFTVAETGFGTGLNFLMTWALWRETARPDARLDFISVEGFPLTPEDLARVHEELGDMQPLAAALRAVLPPRVSGYHAVDLDGGRVRLLLLYGPAKEMLKGLEARVDAWFLDGFAPARNPDMWTPELFTEVARLSRPGARLATFSAAGQVRRDLQAAGFAMTKRPGVGKRECLAGVFEGGRPDDPAPWFAPPEPLQAGSRVAVIGAGIAGAAAARAIAGAGFEVSLFDSGRPGNGASGTPAAVVQARPLSGGDANARFHAASYRRAIALYDELAATGADIWRARGLLSIGRDAEDAGRYRRLVEAGVLGPGAAQWLAPDDAADATGLGVGRSGAWFPEAGALNTEALLAALTGEVAVRRDTAIIGLTAAESGWRLVDGSGADIAMADAVVVAAGYSTQALSGFPDLGLFANRGQVTHIEGSKLAPLRAPISFGGYMVPHGGGAVIGSTFRRMEDAASGDWHEPDPADDDANLALLADGLGIDGPGVRGNWVGLRATTRDRFPVLGAVPDPMAYMRDFAAIQHGAKAGPFPGVAYRNGLYVFAGLGSRGFLTAPLAADLLAARLAGRPLAQPRDVLDAMHPARFLLQCLKRGLAEATMPGR